MKYIVFVIIMPFWIAGLAVMGVISMCLLDELSKDYLKIPSEILKSKP